MWFYIIFQYNNHLFAPAVYKLFYENIFCAFYGEFLFLAAALHPLKKILRRPAPADRKDYPDNLFSQR